MEELQNIFNSHEIEDQAQKELRECFEKMIISAFYEKTSNKKLVIKDSNKYNDTCKGLCYAGTSRERPCTAKPKDNGYCSRHNPDKVQKPKKKIVNKNSCNAIIKKSKKQCSSNGTVKPEGAEFHYCKRHSEKWEEFEPKVSDDET